MRHCGAFCFFKRMTKNFWNRRPKRKIYAIEPPVPESPNAISELSEFSDAKQIKIGFCLGGCPVMQNRGQEAVSDFVHLQLYLAICVLTPPSLSFLRCGEMPKINLRRMLISCFLITMPYVGTPCHFFWRILIIEAWKKPKIMIRLEW